MTKALATRNAWASIRSKSGCAWRACSANDRLPLALKDLAARADMPPAKAHRYLVSLIRAGLAEQDRESGRYRLGPLALELGLAALGTMDVLKFGAEVIADLRGEIDETVLLAIWGNKGPVVARWEESTRPVATNVRAGWVMPARQLGHRTPVRRVLARSGDGADAESGVRAHARRRSAATPSAWRRSARAAFARAGRFAARRRLRGRAGVRPRRRHRRGDRRARTARWIRRRVGGSHRQRR